MACSDVHPSGVPLWCTICDRQVGDVSVYCWRNMASCVNLLRVLNKLTKWKHSRIMVSNNVE